MTRRWETVTVDQCIAFRKVKDARFWVTGLGTDVNTGLMLAVVRVHKDRGPRLREKKVQY